LNSRVSLSLGTVSGRASSKRRTNHDDVEQNIDRGRVHRHDCCCGRDGRFGATSVPGRTGFRDRCRQTHVPTIQGLRRLCWPALLLGKAVSPRSPCVRARSPCVPAWFVPVARSRLLGLISGAPRSSGCNAFAAPCIAPPSVRPGLASARSNRSSSRAMSSSVNMIVTGSALRARSRSWVRNFWSSCLSPRPDPSRRHVPTAQSVDGVWVGIDRNPRNNPMQSKSLPGFAIACAIYWTCFVSAFIARNKAEISRRSAMASAV
jgi:hypothetical protein